MKKFLISCLFISSCLALSAQYSKKILYHQNWEIGAEGGVNYYFAEGFSDYKVSDALGQVYRLGVGYNFNPILKVFGQVEFASHTWPQKNLNMIPVDFSSQLMILNLSVDLKNLFKRYNYTDRFGLSIFGGAGVGQRNNIGTSPSLFTYVINAGVEAKYRLNDKMDLNLKAGSHIIDDGFNNFIGTRLPFDLNPSISLGLSYKFPSGETSWYKLSQNYNLKPTRKRKSLNLRVY